MYGAGKERFQELVELMEMRSSSSYRENRQRHLARRMDILQTLAPHLDACSGGVITALEEALASLRPQNMGVAGKARGGVRQYLQNVALAKVKSKGNSRPGDEVHRAVAIYNKLAPGRGFSLIPDQHAEWPAHQPTPRDISACEEGIAAHLKPSAVLRPLAEAYLDEVRGAVASSAQSGSEAGDIYTDVYNAMKRRLDDDYGVVKPYSVLMTRSDVQDPYIARYPDLVAADFTRTLETQGLVETGKEVSLDMQNGISYARGTGSAGSNKRRRLENTEPEEIMQWAGLYWLKKGENNTELSPKQLLKLQPAEIQRSLREQNISEVEQIEIFQSLAEHVFASRERENITQVPSDWLHALAGIIKQSPADACQGLFHAVVMLACTFNYPDVLRSLDQPQPSSEHALHDLLRSTHMNSPAPTGELPMTVAAMHGHHEILAMLAGYGANVNIRDSQGLTPVLHAVLNGQAAALQTLIEAHADIDEFDANGVPTVLLAAAKNHAPVAAILMDASPAARSGRHRFDMMVHAARHRSDALMEVLKQRQTSLEVKNRHGITPLLKAIFNNDLGAVQFLIGHGADIESPDLLGNTPLLVASRVADLDITRFLLERHANLEHLNNGQMTALMFAAKQGNYPALEIFISAKAAAGPQALQQYVNLQDAVGKTALMYAAANGDSRSLKMLINAQAGLDHRDVLEQNVLVYAASGAREEAIKLLLEAKAIEGEPALKDFVNSKNGEGATALMIAAGKGHPGIVRLLVNTHADPDATDDEGITALSYAAMGNVETVRALLEAKEAEGADTLALYVNHRNHYNETALMTAAIKGTPDIVAALIEAHADVDAQDDNHLTALSHAARRGRTDNIETLIQAGADIDEPDRKKETPLIKAIKGGHDEAARFLILAGAVTHLMDGSNRMALTHAARSGSDTLVRELIASFEDLEQADLINHKDSDGMSALMHACANGHAHIVEVLIQTAKTLAESGQLEEGLAIEDSDNMRKNALMHASASGSAATVNVLTSLGVELNAQDLEGATAIMHAARHSHFAVINALIAANPGTDAMAAADINLATREGESPLMAAAFTNHFPTVSALLVQPGICGDAMDSMGRNALMYAARKENADPLIIASLLPRTPDIYAADREGMDVFRHAVKSKSFLALKSLIAAGYDPQQATAKDRRRAAMVIAEETGDQTIINYLKKDLGLK
jgi:ankyrin repeat protein